MIRVLKDIIINDAAIKSGGTEIKMTDQLNNNRIINEENLEDKQDEELTLYARFDYRVNANWDMQYFSFQDFQEWLYDTFGYDFYVENNNYGNHDNRVAFYLKGDSDIHDTILEEYLEDATLVLKGTIEEDGIYIRSVEISQRKLDFANNRRKEVHITFINKYDSYMAADCDYLKTIVSQLAVAREQKKLVKKRIKNWYTYVKLLEEKAKEEDVYLDYSGYQISNDLKNIEFIILDGSLLGKKKNLFNANVKIRPYSYSDYSEPEYDEQEADDDYESIGKYVKYRSDNNTLVVELDDEWIEAVEQNKLSLPEYGKLFISNLGDLAQARRLQNGLIQLENGKAKNPNLENVLFAERVIVDNVDNQYSFDESTMLMKDLNQYQKKAVEGALKAKDLFLIQGPPGTGKTTVIAEICYQGAAKGLKTLVASQSNLAVDNALSRLKIDPKIRILRKGNASRVEEEGIDFTEDRVIDRWLLDTFNLCKEEADSIKKELSLQMRAWEALKEELEQKLILRGNKEQEKEERKQKSKSLQGICSMLQRELNQVNNEIAQMEPELKRLTALLLNIGEIEAKQNRLNNYILPIAEQREVVCKELRELEELIQEKTSYKKELKTELETQRAKRQNVEKELTKLQQEKENTEQLIGSYENGKREYENYDNILIECEKALPQLNSKYEAYALLVKMVKEKEKDKENLSWYQTNYPTDVIRNETGILGIKNSKAMSLLQMADNTGSKESYAEKILLAVDDYLNCANSLCTNIFDQEVSNKLKIITENLKIFCDSLKQLVNRYEDGKNVDEFYNHLADVAREFEIDVRFIVVDNNMNYNNTDTLEQLRLQAQNVMLEKPGKIRRLFGLTGSWKEHFFKIISRTKGLKQKIDQEKASILDNIDVGEGADNLLNHYQQFKMFYQQILPDLISKKQEKIDYAEMELKRIGYDGQENAIINTFNELCVKINDITYSKQNAENRLSELKPLLNKKIEEIKALGFNVYEKINMLKEQIAVTDSEYNELQRDYATNKDLLEQLENEISVLRTKERVKNERKVNLIHAAEPYETALKETKTDYDELEQTIMNLGYDAHDRVKWLQEEINHKTAEYQEMNRHFSDVNLQYQKEEREIVAINSELEELQGRIPVLKRKVTMEAPDRKLAVKLKRLAFIENWMQRLQEPKPEEKKGLKQLYIDEANVIGITCVQSGSKSFTNDYPDFDVVIIDEVSKATPPELLLPMLKARKLILVGDHKQLPPMIGDDTLAEVVDGLNYSDAEKEETKNYFKTSVFEKLFEAESIPNENKASLVVQYRMHRYIMDTINQFYKDNEANGLQCGIEDNLRDHGFNCHYIKPSDHVLWYNFPIAQAYREMPGSSGKSFYNDAEIEQVMKILFDMSDDIIRRKNSDLLNKEYKKSVGVISFYAEQVKKLKAKIWGCNELKENLSIRIGTVDRFQGMERDVIIASFVRNNNSRRIGFAKEFRRVNVALSRARELLVIVGCADLFCNPDNNRSKEAAEMYANVLEQVKLHDGFRNSAGLTI